MKLFYNKFSRATRVRWLLEELGLPYELSPVDMRAREHKSPEYLAIHPLGQLPAMLDDAGRPIFESAAIVMDLADKHGLAPAVGTRERGLWYQWIVYAMVTLEPLVVDYFHHTSFYAEDKRDAAVAAQALAEFDRKVAVVGDALEGHGWLVGGEFSAADVVMGGVLTWAVRMGMGLGSPNVVSYAQRCKARPAFNAART